MRVVLQLCLCICGIFASSIVDNNNTYKDCVNTVLMCSGSAENCKRMYRELAKEVHSDKTGLDDSFMMFLNSKKPICTSKHAWSQCSDARTSCLHRETVEPKKMHDGRKSKKMHNRRKSKKMHNRRKSKKMHDKRKEPEQQPQISERCLVALLLLYIQYKMQLFGSNVCIDGYSNDLLNLRNQICALMLALALLYPHRIIYFFKPAPHS